MMSFVYIKCISSGFLIDVFYEIIIHMWISGMIDQTCCIFKIP